MGMLRPKTTVIDMQLLHTRTKLLRDTTSNGDGMATTTTTKGFKLDSAKRVRDHDDNGQQRDYYGRRVISNLERGTASRDQIQSETRQNETIKRRQIKQRGDVELETGY